jgi:hypothetical protein
MCRISNSKLCTKLNQIKIEKNMIGKFYLAIYESYYMTLFMKHSKKFILNLKRLRNFNDIGSFGDIGNGRN